MDLDTNSYPDLAVGSLSDAALIYRYNVFYDVSFKRVSGGG